jgi:plasmid segregation protein ParM
MQIIAIDNGRDAIKAITGKKRVVIPSVVGEPRDLKIREGGSDEWEVEIDGRRYFVGDLAINESRFKRENVEASKIHEDTLVLTLTALAILAEQGQPIRLITGLPVDQHTPQVKDAYKALLAGSHAVRINRGRKQTIAIDDDMLVSIEGAGAYWSEVLDNETSQLPHQRCRILDLGSRTINYLTIDAGIRFSDLHSGTLPYGCIELENADGSAEPTPATCENLARKIAADMSRKWLDFAETDTVLLAGGGALQLEKWLRHHYPKARIVNDPVFANALGWLKMGEQKWLNQKK